jgi:hypothetical protein
MKNIKQKLKEMITDDLLNHFNNVNIQQTFPNIGKWVRYMDGFEQGHIASVPKFKYRFESGITPNIRVQWINSYFYIPVKTTSTTGVERYAQKWFVSFNDMNKLVNEDEIGHSGWLRTQRFDDIKLPNIDIDKMTFMDIILHNKLPLLLKCNWTIEVDVKGLEGKGFYIKSGRFIDGEHRIDVDWVSLMREEKLKALGL